MWVSECYFKEPLCGKKNDLVAPICLEMHILNSNLGYFTLHTALCRISFHMTLCLTELFASNCQKGLDGVN